MKEEKHSQIRDVGDVESHSVMGWVWLRGIGASTCTDSGSIPAKGSRDDAPVFFFCS